MGKNLFIAEKPSVAREFSKALKQNMQSYDGYLESNDSIVTWCVGHLVTMSYPEIYDEKYRRWSFDTIPFLPDDFLYEVIDNVKKQFNIVSGLLNRADVDVIYVCTDSGREGEYIYRLVERQAKVQGKTRKRVWIDSQTEEEILRGIREAKDLSYYDNLCNAAYLRAKEDYLMGINFSRVLTLRYGKQIKDFLSIDRAVVSVGRVMTCVLGMVVNREREIREFVKTPFYRVLAQSSLNDSSSTISLEWKSQEKSLYFESPKLYKENGFKNKEDADALIASLLNEDKQANGSVVSISKKKETKNPPLLYNLAELQNDCSKYFKISPDETLKIAQELYEKKLTTYPRTDARVLSTAVSKEIHKNIGGLTNYQIVSDIAKDVLNKNSYKDIAKSRYVNDKQITDHYAIIPTGQGLQNLNSLSDTAKKVYEIIARRFLAIFYPGAVYEKISLCIGIPVGDKEEQLFANFKVMSSEGYLPVSTFSFAKKKTDNAKSGADNSENAKNPENEAEAADIDVDESFMKELLNLKKGSPIILGNIEVKEGETSPPKRYNSGSMILAMENAGQLIEDEELRAQIKGSGIGTSATRAEILKKLVNNNYLSLHKKTQIITPTLLGELIFEVVNVSIKGLLDPKLTASWEKGLTMVANGEISEDEYMDKLSDFVARRTNFVKQNDNRRALYSRFNYVKGCYVK